MKKMYLVFIILFSVYASKSQTTYPSGVSGCIARWTFDVPEFLPFLDTLPDMSGNNNPGSVHNISSLQGWRNKPLSAGGFDGTSSFAEVAHKSMLVPNEITSIVLIKFNSFYSGNCQGNNIIYKGFDYSGNCDWAMYVADADACTQFTPTTERPVFQAANSPSMASIPSGNFLNTGNWYFIATSFDGTYTKYYQISMDTNIKATNILPLYSFNTSTPLGTGTDDIFIGATQNPPFRYWLNGSMDELILFNRALTDNEIQSVYDYLWGWVTGLDEAQKVNQNIITYCKNNLLSVECLEQSINKIEIFDISGRSLKEVYHDFNNIDLSSTNDKFLIIKIKLGNNLIISKKIIND